MADNSTGISQEVQQKLFEPLFTTKLLGKGTGLGMVISQRLDALRIAQQIIEVTNQEKMSVSLVRSKGTEFTIEIPLKI